MCVFGKHIVFSQPSRALLSTFFLDDSDHVDHSTGNACECLEIWMKEHYVAVAHFLVNARCGAVVVACVSLWIICFVRLWLFGDAKEMPSRLLALLL